MRSQNLFRTANLLVFICACAVAQPSAMRKVMITEVTPDNPQAVEVMNFDSVAVNLTGWVVKWRDNSGTAVSTPFSGLIQPGEILIIREAGGTTYPGAPPQVPVLPSLPVLSTSLSHAVTVALVNAGNVAVDEVRVAAGSGTTTQGGLGGVFRGVARFGGNIWGSDNSAERIWGLDSDGGLDWTQCMYRSMGRENASSGVRGTDTVAVKNVVFNEIDVRTLFGLNLDSIELRNLSGAVLDLNGWLLLCSGQQGQAPVVLAPWTGPALIPAGAYFVVHQGGPPGEMPAGTFAYALTTPAIPFSTEEFSCALYDNFGRLVDLVRTTGHDDLVVHNHPRAPSYWSEFTGAAGREGGFASIGRNASSTDTGTGADWRPTAIRTMGAANTSFASGPGLAAALDARLHETGLGQGLTLIVNAGSSRAYARFDLLFSLDRSFGQGPLLGLGFDAMSHFVAYSIPGIPPFGAILGSDGSYRFDLPPGSIPAGIRTDNLAVVEDAANPALALMTRVLEFDT